jgi:hypothetical protein
MVCGALAVVVAMLVAGCGGSDSSSGKSSTAEGGGTQTVEETGTGGAEAKAPEAGGGAQGSGGEGNESEEAAPEAEGSEEPVQGASQSPEKSLETFGSDAGGAARSEVLAGWHGYLRDIESRNFKGVCQRLTAANLKSIEAYLGAGTQAKLGKNCPELVGSVLKDAGPDARNAAAGKIDLVRMRGSDAIIIFTPRGAKERSYFTMTKEGGTWRVISLTTGTPMNPLGQ